MRERRDNKRTLTISIENHLYLSRLKLDLADKTQKIIDFDDVIKELRAIYDYYNKQRTINKGKQK